MRARLARQDVRPDVDPARSPGRCERELLSRKLPGRSLSARERIPWFEWVPIEDDLQSSSANGFSGKEPMKHHREMLGDLFGEGVECPCGALAIGAFVPENPVQSLP